MARVIRAAGLTVISAKKANAVCVDEALRGQHIGRSLYEYVLQYAKEQGCYNVTLNVWAENKNAMRFYESCGLEPQKIGMEKIIR